MAGEPILVVEHLPINRKLMLVLTRRMKAAPETRNLCVIAVTSYAMNGDELKARQAGCDGYITKPVDARALLELAARSLARGRQEGQS